MVSINTQEQFREQVQPYIRCGERVAEIYHGERDDILNNLSDLVGEEGVVYGIDQLNPFPWHQNMVGLQRLRNVRLIRARIPRVQEEVSHLNAVIIRELLWTQYDGGEKESGVFEPSNSVYRWLDSIIEGGGYFIIAFKEGEAETEWNGICQTVVRLHLPNFTRIFRGHKALVYKKPE